MGLRVRKQLFPDGYDDRVGYQDPRRENKSEIQAWSPGQSREKRKHGWAASQGSRPEISQRLTTDYEGGGQE